MAFDVHPDQGRAPLTLSKGIRSRSSFSERVALDPASGRTLMYLALVKLAAGCAAPDGPDPAIRLQVGNGAPVEVGVSTPLQDEPSGRDPVAVASLSSAGHVQVVEIEVLRTGGRWDLELEHGGPAQTYDFTWVVADRLAEVRQPWLHMAQTSLDFMVHPLQRQPQSVNVVNRGTGALRLTDQTPMPLGDGFVLDEITPRAIEPHQCARATISFTGPVFPGTTTATYTARSNDTFGGSGLGHNRQLQLTATTTLAAPPPVVHGVEPNFGHPDEPFTIVGSHLVLAGGDDVTIEFESPPDPGRLGDGPGTMTRARVEQPTSSTAVTAFVADVPFRHHDLETCEVFLVRSDGQRVKVHDQFDVQFL